MPKRNFEMKTLTFKDGWVADWTFAHVVVRYDAYNGVPYEPVTIHVDQPDPADLEWMGENPDQVYDLVRIWVSDDASGFGEWSHVNDLVELLSGVSTTTPCVYPVSALPRVVSTFNALGRLDWLRFEYVAITDSLRYERRVKALAAKRTGA